MSLDSIAEKEPRLQKFLEEYKELCGKHGFEVVVASEGTYICRYDVGDEISLRYAEVDIDPPEPRPVKPTFWDRAAELQQGIRKAKTVGRYEGLKAEQEYGAELYTQCINLGADRASAAAWTNSKRLMYIEEKQAALKHILGT